MKEFVTVSEIHPHPSSSEEYINGTDSSEIMSGRKIESLENFWGIIVWVNQWNIKGNRQQQKYLKEAWFFKILSGKTEPSSRIWRWALLSPCMDRKDKIQQMHKDPNGNSQT